MCHLKPTNEWRNHHPLPLRKTTKTPLPLFENHQNNILFLFFQYNNKLASKIQTTHTRHDKENIATVYHYISTIQVRSHVLINLEKVECTVPQIEEASCLYQHRILCASDTPVNFRPNTLQTFIPSKFQRITITMQSNELINNETRKMKMKIKTNLRAPLALALWTSVMFTRSLCSCERTRHGASAARQRNASGTRIFI